MKNRRSRFLFVAIVTILISFSASGAFAATGVCDVPTTPRTIEVEATAGTAQGGYATLSAAFAAINAGIHRGTIDVDVCGDTTEPAAGAVLNASGSGFASYATVSIKPVGGVSRLIVGFATAGRPLIDLNGADKVTIDGVGSGGNALTISNNTASAVARTSTIRFFDGANDNVVTNATIAGAFIGPVTVPGGTIYFATSSGAASNFRDSISNCNIGPAGPGTRPTKAIHSTGAAGVGSNNDIVITNNNIFDFFSATVNSAGVYVEGVNTRWTISNNRFYQTAARTRTAAANHRAIEISGSLAEAFTITGNAIGHASANQTGTYTLTGAAGKFCGIYFAGHPSAGSSIISSNIIAAISSAATSSGTGASSPFMAIYVNSGTVATNDNSIGSQSATDSLLFTTNTSSTTQVIGIGNEGSTGDWMANGNTIGGITAQNIGIGRLTVNVIHANFTGTQDFTASSNVVGGPVPNSIQSSASLSEVNGITGLHCATNFAANTIRNLVSSGSGLVNGILVAANDLGSSQAVTQNSIHNLVAQVGSVIGISVDAGTSTEGLVARNFVHSLISPITVTGIAFGGGGSVCKNNMIALGSGVSNGASVFGINDRNGAYEQANSFYFNSVYIGGSAGAGTANSYAFSTSHTSVRSRCQDNIFANARSNALAAGKHYAIDISGFGSVGLTSDSNVLYVTGQGIVGRDGADFQTLAQWQAATERDQLSYSSDPRYAGPTLSPPNLHIGAGPTDVEGRGLAIAGTDDDFDGDVRTGLTPTDIGADAGNFQRSDPNGPTILYTPLANSINLVSRVLAISVIDVSGVPTSGTGLPVLYFRKNSGAYVAAQCAPTSGNDYACTIQYSSVGGVIPGDTIFYYVAAQDNLGNVATNPEGAAGLTASPPAAGTPPPPNSFSIIASLSQVRTVCASGCDYSTLTGAGGAFAALNAIALTGNLDLQIAGDLVIGEDGSVALNHLLEKPSGSNFQVRIYPVGAPRVITSTAAPDAAFIRLNATAHVTIDGSLGGDGADRSLTVTNTSPSATSSVILLQSGGNAVSTSNIIANLIVVGNNSATTRVGIEMSSGLAEHNKIQNNDIRGVQYGIWTQGLNASVKSFGNFFTQNVMNSVTKGGIRLGYENLPQVTENRIDGVTQAGEPGVFAIALGLTEISPTGFTGFEVMNATVARNLIGTVHNTGTYSAVGIAVASASHGTTTIINNMIHGVAANGTSGRLGAGIFLGGGAGSTTLVYHNSVSMTGSLSGGSEAIYGLAIGGSDPVVDVRNNVFLNSQTNGAGPSYAIGAASSTFLNLLSNTNAFYVPPGGGSFKIGKTGGLAAGTGTEHVLLSGWRAATGQDATSIDEAPGFVSTTDLHIASPGLQPVEDAGAPLPMYLPTITFDIDEDPRSTLHPDIGADEVDRCAGVVCPHSGGCGSYACNPVDGTCVPDYLPANTVCRPSGGDCDLTEACTGDSVACPADAKRTDTCRPSAGSCDVAEQCDGAGNNCPADVVLSELTVCRASAGSCDIAETCDGVTGVCPSNAVAPASVECRAAAGNCDTAEFCDGLTTSCPSNVVTPAGVECRVAAGECDSAESCDGVTGVCPVDVIEAAGTECRSSAGDCDIVESCDGMTVACPADVFAPVGVECRAAAGNCDVAESCNGMTVDCPSDVVAPVSLECRSAAGSCDVAEFCDGSTGACPPDVVVPVGVECRTSAGDCDIAESCDGSQGTCPADAFLPEITECRPSTETCDPAEFCSGNGPTCPEDVVDSCAAAGNSVRLGYDRSTEVSTITWSESDPGPFNIYRGVRGNGTAWTYNQSCLAHGLVEETSTDATMPVPGELYFYLISREEPPCPESALGFDSAGVMRPNPDVCPE